MLNGITNKTGDRVRVSKNSKIKKSVLELRVFNFDF
jgi:hypothetical protein